jgi:hypothetical protein
MTGLPGGAESLVPTAPFLTSREEIMRLKCFKDGHRTNWRISLTRAGSVRMSPCSANQRSNVEVSNRTCKRKLT